MHRENTSMNRRKVLALAGIGAASAVAGCLSASGSETGENSTTGTGDLTIEEVESVDIEQKGERTLEVTGTGVIEAEPNRATLSASIEAHDRDNANAVVEELAARSDQFVEDLTAAGISEDDITTTNYSLRESSRNNRYEGEHRYTIELDDPDAVGETIDLVANSEADQIGRINFTLTEERREELYDYAVERAVSGAREEAELYASAAGVTLGDPVSIETSDRNVSPFARSFATAADATDEAPVTTIQEGDVAVTARATIKYEFTPSEE